MKGEDMPLNEREQRILEEIERHLYQEDPKLAETVAKTSLDSKTRRLRLVAVIGLIVGLVLMVAMFQQQTLIAALGFIIMVGCGVWLATHSRIGRTESGSGSVIDALIDRGKQRRQRDG